MCETWVSQAQSTFKTTTDWLIYRIKGDKIILNPFKYSEESLIQINNAYQVQEYFKVCSKQFH